MGLKRCEAPFLMRDTSSNGEASWWALLRCCAAGRGEITIFESESEIYIMDFPRLEGKRGSPHDPNRGRFFIFITRAGLF